MNASFMLMIGGVSAGVLFLVVMLIGLRVLPWGIVWHKRLAITAVVLAFLHGTGGVLNMLGLLPF